jgi:hypothetical protein
MDGENKSWLKFLPQTQILLDRYIFHTNKLEKHSCCAPNGRPTQHAVKLVTVEIHSFYPGKLVPWAMCWKPARMKYTCPFFLLSAHLWNATLYLGLMSQAVKSKYYVFIMSVH